MTAADILMTLENAGCQLRLESGQLIVRDPKRALTDALREQIRQYKNELLSVLIRRDNIPPHQCIGLCNNCDSSDIYVDGPVRICKACKSDWLLPCPQCQCQLWGKPKGRWTCKKCGYQWPPTGAALQDVQTAVQIIRHPDGYEMTIPIYKCPSCQGINWGPKVDDPDIWVCLTCYSNQENR